MSGAPLDTLLGLALAEDLGPAQPDPAGDLTTVATVPADAFAAGELVAREPGVVAGVDVAAAVFARVDPTVDFERVADDGARVTAGATVARVSGRARSLLAAERTALNLLSHLCGVATATASFVDAVAGTGCVVLDTRKTLPGLRPLQKAAVAAAGGANHRMGLFDALLVKDNHVAAAGGVAAATRLAVARGGGRRVQVEVDSLAQLDEALEAGAPAVLLDNFPLSDLRAAVARCRDRGVFTEASGGVTLERVRAIAETGVDAVSVGALTHSVRALDIGLDFVGGVLDPP